MATPSSFRLGLLPERKMDWRTLATSYGVQVVLVILLINIGMIWPDRLQIAQKYHVTELIPMPSLQPKPLKMKQPQSQLHAKLLPRAPVFDSPKLTVPRDVRTPRPQQPDVTPPKIAMNNFAPAVLKQVSGGARPTLIVHTGEFGSSATPTVNAPIQKVQTGGFGDPNGIKGQGKENAHLVAANTLQNGVHDRPLRRCLLPAIVRFFLRQVHHFRQTSIKLQFVIENEDAAPDNPSWFTDPLAGAPTQTKIHRRLAFA